MRNSILPYDLPTIEEEAKQEVVDSLASGCFTAGPKCIQLEEQACSYLDIRNAIVLNSHTAALHLTLAALGIGEGDEVITSPLTFCSTPNVIMHQKATPVLADISSDTWSIDPEKVEAAITQNTKAIIPVHYGGYPCEMDQLLDIASSRGLAIIEDAAYALGAHYKGIPIGKFGDATCFTFCVHKNLHTSEGGMITTNRDEFGEHLRVLSQHGISKNAIVQHTSENSWFYQVVAPGYDYGMTDLQAIAGIHQITHVEDFLAARTGIANQYREAFQDIDAIDMPEVKEYVRHAWQLFPILVNLDKLTIDRAKFIEELRVRNIETTVNYIPIHFHQYFRDFFGEQEGRYPIAEWIYHREISLPIYARMSEQDVNDVIEAVVDVVEKFRR